MTTITPPAIPIACSLSSEQLADRAGAWRTLLTTSLVTRARVRGGVRLTVHPGASASLQTLVDLEQECCPWITFLLEGDVVTITAAGEGESIVVEMFAWSGTNSQRRDVSHRVTLS